MTVIWLDRVLVKAVVVVENLDETKEGKSLKQTYQAKTTGTKMSVEAAKQGIR